MNGEKEKEVGRNEREKIERGKRGKVKDRKGQNRQEGKKEK